MATSVRFDGFRLDPATRQLRTEAGAPVALTAKAFDTLAYLVEHRDRVVSKDELLASVWAGRVVEENNLTQAISALRRAFGTGAGEHRYIVTVPGRGYRFVAELDPAPLDAGAPVPVAGTPAAASAPRRPRWEHALVPGALLFLLALMSIAAWQSQDRGAASPRVVPPAPAAATGAPADTLAVLPFRSLSPGPRDELLELGLADTLIARISSASTLHVRSLASSQRFAGSRHDPLEAARKLGATYIVEGTTQRNGDAIRVSTRLLDARDGRAVWSGTFDESIGRVFTLQDRIAASITSALALKLAPATGRPPCEGANADAYRAYLTGSYQLGRPSAERMRSALAAFYRAIDLDPTCARAYAGLSFAYRALVMTGDENPRVAFPLAEAAVEKALAIDPGLAEGYSSRGFIQFWYGWDWAASEASLKRAIELNPSLAEAHLAYAHLLHNIGRMPEAAVHAREAIALDPLSPLVGTLGAAFLGAAGHRDESAAVLDGVLERDPEFWTALMVRAQRRIKQGDPAGAVADMRRALSLCGNCSQAEAVLGATLVAAGDRDGARALVRAMHERRREDYVPATSIAAVHNALGDTDAALDLLERAYAERDVRMTFLASDTRWHNLRSQPRFRALLQRMRLTAG
ncbi:winged helix-turn-helix domain-containing protein [Cognatilysobacter tabacisoli]|uniref:winged helix-turn-helix domain-containing protein n=1 Tax=Cognatilysobacter tabacisoli TaxID=2315424 RepID=UPI000E6B0BCC|nr:winged helix-turn-helix domain-containing protein [Lysobacter tabacisoli]